MGRIIITEFVSLDGIAEDPGGAEGFERGGWAFEISRGDEGDTFKLDETAASDALLLGRLTYDGFAKAWPSRDGPFADKFNNMPKYVVSSTLRQASWKNSTIIDGDLDEAVAALRRQYHGDIVVHGSLQLARALMERDLADELRLMVYPVLLGKGKTLFNTGGSKKRMHLVESRTVGDGVAILVYRLTSAAAMRDVRQA
jgi:dihydrofolate reductase